MGRVRALITKVRPLMPGIRFLAIAVMLILAGFAVAVRWLLFSAGILYGNTAAKMASLTVAAIIVAVGGIVMRISHRTEETTSDTPRPSPSDVSGASTLNIVGSVTAIVGLATAAYGVSEIVAPNTPVAAGQPACGGVPVYGAGYLAVTQQTGVNARSGPGREFSQRNRYAGDCTLGFDGYCIGPPEPDFVLHSPDQRWLKVYKRDEFVSAAVVLSQSPERQLGSGPLPSCREHGGLPEPTAIQTFTYDISTGALSATATSAVAVGYGLAAPAPFNPRFHVGTLGTVDPGFEAKLSPTSMGGLLGVINGEIWLGATVCLADNVPVPGTLRVMELRLRKGALTSEAPAADFPRNLRTEMAENDCNSSG
jgi:hypothetical protein